MSSRWRSSRCILPVFLGLALPGVELAAQCPDGSAPPCRSATRYDSTTLVVVPLAAVGGDAKLARAGADFAAIVAQNLIVGSLRAVSDAEVAGAPASLRPRAAARKGAGGLVTGSLSLIGARARVTIQLSAVATGRTIVSSALEAHPDSLLTLADRATVPLLKAWWARHRPGDHLRAGLTTQSLEALRAYISGMELLRRGADYQSRMLDAIQSDPSFIAPWLWLAVAQSNARPNLHSFSGPPFDGVGLDSALRVLSVARDAQAREIGLPLRDAIDLSFSPAAPPTPEGLLLPLPCSRGVSEIESQFLCALLARKAIVMGLPDTTAVRIARAVVERDSEFIPGWRLLVDLLTDAGDSAALRGVERGLRPPVDTAVFKVPLSRILSRRFERHPLPLRSGFPVVDRFIDAGDTASARRLALRLFGGDSIRFAPYAAALAAYGTTPGATEQELLSWRRFERLRELQLRAPDVSLAMLTTLGMRDSATKLAREALTPRPGSPSPGGPRIRLLSLPMISRAFVLPIDTASLPWQPGVEDLDSLVRALTPARAADAPGVEGGSPMNRPTLVFTTWLVGVIANQRDDSPTALRAVAILDSVLAPDAGRVNRGTHYPLLLGLKAEVALRTDTARAVSLLLQALRTSAIRTPARYRFLLATVFAARGKHAAALSLARSITAPSGFHEPESAFYFADALRLEAEALEALGRPNEALPLYRRYLSLRDAADPSLFADIAAVRAAVARLSPTLP